MQKIKMELLMYNMLEIPYGLFLKVTAFYNSEKPIGTSGYRLLFSYNKCGTFCCNDI